MKPVNTLVTIAAILSIAGCQQGQVVASSGKSVSTANPADQASQAAPPPSPPPTLPDSLKNDAYHWFGLGYGKPIMLKFSATGAPAVTGSETIKLKSVSDGKAVYETARTGQFGEQLGDETASLENDGIYAIGSSKSTSKFHNLDMPAKVHPGSTWTNSGTIDMDSGKVTQNLVLKVVGETDVTTQVGKQHALLVKTTGTIDSGSQKFRMEASQWYVKDKGLVKMVIKRWNLADKKPKADEITIQEIKG